MSYEVLARRWRPHTFSEVVGQGHVLRALINALDSGRLHHAFLFTGTRGVGKTTLARILAKSINCDQGISSTPCGECPTCKEIDEGRFADLIEVDAASRTKVEDTRELLENVQYAPTRGRYKVYLIDEVHMLSNHSFNALLKTLEEPPPHVKFLLATTDPQKLPVTILSRCLQFNLKRIPNDEIESQLNKIIQSESIQTEAEATEEIAEAADGSMRDGLSLLDQAIAYGAGELKTSEVRDMLGTIDRQRILAIVHRLAASDSSGLMAEVETLSEVAPDFTALLHELNRRFQQIALLQQIPGAAGPRVSEREQLMQFAQSMDPEDIQLYYQIGLAGVRDMPYVPDSRTGFEMVLLRMLAFQPAGKGVKKKLVEPVKPAAKKPVKSELLQTTEPPPLKAVQKSINSQSTPAPHKTKGAENKVLDKPVSVKTPEKPEIKEGDATPLKVNITEDKAMEKPAPVKTPEKREVKQETATPPVSDSLADMIPIEEYNDMPPPEWQGYEEDFLPVKEVVQPVQSKPQDKPAAHVNQAKPVARSAVKPVVQEKKEEEELPALFDQDAVIDGRPSDWHNWISHLKISAMTRQLADHCVISDINGNTITLSLDQNFIYLNKPNWLKKLEYALCEYLKGTVKLIIAKTAEAPHTPAKQRDQQKQEKQQAAKQAIFDDKLVQDIIETFDAEVIDETIRPREQ